MIITVPLIIIFAISLVFFTSCIIDYNKQCKEFNNGRCKICGKLLKLSDINEHGRIYSCKVCKCSMVVTHAKIDYKYIKRLYL